MDEMNENVKVIYMHSLANALRTILAVKLLVGDFCSQEIYE